MIEPHVKVRFFYGIDERAEFMYRNVKKRRRRKIYNWPSEIARGNIDKFYKSTDWKDMREQILMRDKYVCQFFKGSFEQYGHTPNQISLMRANTVHHIKPIKEYPELCLDSNNLISLSHDAHEIIEGRADRLKDWNEKQKKPPLTKERW